MGGTTCGASFRRPVLARSRRCSSPWPLRRPPPLPSRGWKLPPKASMPAGAMHFILSGADRASAEQLIVVRLPDATEESTGLSTQPSPDHAWLMFPGTHQAHMMIGAPPYGWAENK